MKEKRITQKQHTRKIEKAIRDLDVLIFYHKKTLGWLEGQRLHLETDLEQWKEKTPNGNQS